MQTFRLLKIARIVKALRVIRVFKLARHSIGLKALGKTISANVKELGLLFLLLFMFASLAFVFEKDDPNTSFKTIFDAYWWAIVTMTTVRQRRKTEEKLESHERQTTICTRDNK